MCILSVACIVSLICFVHESYPNYSSCCFVACRLWHISKYQSKKKFFLSGICCCCTKLFLAYILFYVVMFMRLIILESDRHSLWIKIVGIILIAIRFADWPYELAFQSIQQDIMSQKVAEGATCWATWYVVSTAKYRLHNLQT